jgi:hypothetical protein
MQGWTGSKRKWLWAGSIGVPVVGVATTALYLWVTFGFTYSLGERVGIVQKTSESGWACSTYKGELAMASEAGPTAGVFTFTVRDKYVAAQIDELAGQRVVLHYEQHKGVPSTCFGDSEYFVTAVRKL